MNGGFGNHRRRRIRSSQRLGAPRTPGHLICHELGIPGRFSNGNRSRHHRHFAGFETLLNTRSKQRRLEKPGPRGGPHELVPPASTFCIENAAVLVDVRCRGIHRHAGCEIRWVRPIWFGPPTVPPSHGLRRADQVWSSQSSRRRTRRWRRDNPPHGARIGQVISSRVAPAPHRVRARQSKPNRS